MKLQAPKGTDDNFLENTNVWHYVEKTASEIFELSNFKEIRTPIFEYTEVFARGVGESTDIVNKEMYTFEKGDRSYTLRPENTAGVVRAYIQNGLFKRPAPQKLWYCGPMFRYERPQGGRRRQFHQIGMEMFGIANASADAEVILTAMKLFKRLNLSNLTLHLNNIGCPACRNDYKEKIKESLKDKLDKLCDDCKRRYNTNPLRLLDCKNETCQNIYSEEPTNSIINSDFICDTCKSNYDDLIFILDESKIDYKFNKKLVRGLDYYNGAVFEITSDNLGAQNAICGGGRYDGLVKLLGGPDTPAVGWALGMERLTSLLQYEKEEKIDAFIVTDNHNRAVVLADILRNSKLKVEMAFSGSKLGKQLEKANKFNAKFAVIMGSEELENNYYTVKNLQTGDQFKYEISDMIACLITNKE
ncbi:MAG: histidine--tRNA ligase [Vampirovibrionia bacterium]